MAPLALLFRSDFKTNEKKIMQELDSLAKNADTRKKKKGGDMKGAVEGTEAIREWVSSVSGLALYHSAIAVL